MFTVAFDPCQLVVAPPVPFGDQLELVPHVFDQNEGQSGGLLCLAELSIDLSEAGVDLLKTGVDLLETAQGLLAKTLDLLNDLLDNLPRARAEALVKVGNQRLVHQTRLLSALRRRTTAYHETRSCPQGRRWSAALFS
jgi:hypothetical protein